MILPKLYVKAGCPWCDEALSYFENKKIDLTIIEVRNDPNKMNDLIRISGQSKTPTLQNGDFVVADFDVGELEEALKTHPDEAKKLGIELET